MQDALKAAMAEALSLTRAGRIAEATAVLRGLPGGMPGGLPGGPPPTAPDAGRDGPMLRPGTGRRAGLAATLRGLAALRGTPAGSGGAVPEPALPPGARFESGRHAEDAGTRDFRLYVPANPGAGPRPLVVMLHGCTQSAEDFAVGTGMNAHAETAGCLVVYPDQPSGANPQRCWNWFDPKDQRRGSGEPSIVVGIVRRVMAEHDVDPRRVHVAGLSAGGAAAAVLGALHPELFASVGVHSGLPVGAARDLPSALAAMRQGASGGAGGRASATPPTIVFHGDRDATVNPSNADALVEQAIAGRHGVRSVEVPGRAPGGRTWRRDVHTDADGRLLCERWLVEGAGHAWSGGSPAGSHTDGAGPDASREMLRFFLETPKRDG
jgi:poly(hydroxyalkanoate) depolymerase family esterase